MENNGNYATARISCKCDRWPERLLHQGCLHDRCHRCDANRSEASVNDGRDIGDCSRREITALCDACNEAMTISAACANDEMLAAEKPFRLDSATVPRTLEGLLGCECCFDKSTSAFQRAAEYLCEDCPVNLLCYECKQSHDRLCGDKHHIMPIEEDLQGLPEHPWARIPALLCRLHDFTCDYWCWSCDNAKCQVCATQCVKRSHSICESDKVDLLSSVDSLRSSTLEVERACSNFRLVELALELEHRADMLELKKRKLRILNALDTTFSAAHGALERSFRETRQWIANFRDCVDSAVRCSRLLTRHPLPSHGILIKRAQRAVDHHMHTAQRLIAREAATLARLGCTTPADNLEDVMKSWLGSPIMLAVPEAVRSIPATLSAENVFRAQLQLPCYDIAATFCGHVLVAAGKSGLQELDSRGFLLDTWLPTSTAASTDSCQYSPVSARCDMEEVVSVDCLEDDRSVVGLKNACAVVLLKRGGNGGSLEWCEQQRFALGQEVPFATAARNSRLVVALGFVRKDSRRPLPGKKLTAFGLNTGTVQASAVLGYEIDSVAVAAGNAVIVTRHFRVDVNPACNEQFVIECRSPDLQACLWRISRDEPILGLAASASGAVVYASVARKRGQRVITLDAATGFIPKITSATRCAGVPNEISSVRRLAINSCSEIRRCYDTDCTDTCAANIPDAVGQTYLLSGDGTRRENWLTSNTVLGKLSCSKAQTSKLVALGFDSKTTFNLPADSEQPLQRGALQRAMCVTKKFLILVVCLALVPLSHVVTIHFRVDVCPACNGQSVIEIRSPDLLDCLWRISRDAQILGLGASAVASVASESSVASGAVVYASVARERGRRVITFDAATGFIPKVTSATKCAGVQNEIRSIRRRLAINSCSENRHCYDADTADTCALTSPTKLAGHTYPPSGDDTQRENWLTSNTVLGKLLCSKAQTSKLLALEFDTNTMSYLSADFEQPSQRDSLRRATYFTWKFLIIVACLILPLCSAYVVTEFTTLFCSVLVNELKAVDVHQNRLIVIVTALVAIYFPNILQGHNEKDAKSYMSGSLLEATRFLKFPFIKRA